MTTSHLGKDAKVVLGSDTVLGIGNWGIDGTSKAEIDDTEFGDQATKYALGIENGGTISFSGNAKLGDTTGQLALMEAYDADTELTQIKLYIDETSYFEPCQTAGYLHPGMTTGANTQVSSVIITGYPISTDKGGLATISFSGRINGKMVLV